MLACQLLWILLYSIEANFFPETIFSKSIPILNLKSSEFSNFKHSNSDYFSDSDFVHLLKDCRKLGFEQTNVDFLPETKNEGENIFRGQV